MKLIKALFCVFMVISQIGCNSDTVKEKRGTSYRSFEGRYEQALDDLKEAKTEKDRFLVLSELAMMSFELGKVSNAQKYAEEVLKMAQNYESNWNYGNVIHKGNIVLGRIAAKNNDINEAIKYLLRAGNTKGSPQLDSFGPNMSLAKTLLEKNERKAVVKYLEACRKFWKMDRDRLDFWIFQIERGKIPEFGANMVY
ncbi:MAG: hypothetical protein OEZ68_17470 [Gammaproteobacteria bacterium]|nr:hypothetical protein [Gammaproteobacteria bacterium]MDH5802594.1 hypothetical protein [Gammaproteobacteria bacterium]